jgi:hypothetical protein
LITLCHDCHQARHEEEAIENHYVALEKNKRASNCWQIIKGVPLLELDTPYYKYGKVELEEFSLYKNILVQWDADYDLRVLLMIDNLAQDIQERLVFIHESHGGVFLIWKDFVPEGWTESSKGFFAESCDGDLANDWWTICESKAVPSCFTNNAINPSCSLKNIIVLEGGGYELK